MHISTNFKNYFSFKNKYTIRSVGLVGHNKRLLQFLTGAEGSTHDVCLLRHSPLFHQIANGEKMPKKIINLADNIGE